MSNIRSRLSETVACWCNISAFSQSFDLVGNKCCILTSNICSYLSVPSFFPTFSCRFVENSLSFLSTLSETEVLIQSWWSFRIIIIAITYFTPLQLYALMQPYTILPFSKRQKKRKEKNTAHAAFRITFLQEFLCVMSSFIACSEPCS